MKNDFAGTLFFVFLVLKLTHVIAWSWWWVTSPLWMPLCFVPFAILYVYAVYGGLENRA